MKRLESIQHLRGMAAMMVVFVHFPTPLRNFCGAIGVDIFFFISGFIIYISIEKTRYYDHPLVFLKKRLLRIIPLYYAVTTLFLLMHAGLDAVRHSDISPHFTTADILRSYLFIPVSHAGVYNDPVVFLGWSLNFEMYFYLLSFVFLIVFRHRFFWPLIAFLSGLAFFGLFQKEDHGIFADFATSSFLLYFTTGLLLGKYHEKIIKKLFPFAESLILISVYLLFLVMLGKDYGYDYSGISRENVIFGAHVFQRFIIWGLPALLFFLSYFSISRKYNLSNRFLNELGNRSYSIYLLQVFFIQVLYEIGFKFNKTGIIILSFILMLLLVWFSGLSYRYFEKRFHS